VAQEQRPVVRRDEDRQSLRQRVELVGEPLVEFLFTDIRRGQDDMADLLVGIRKLRIFHHVAECVADDLRTHAVAGDPEIVGCDLLVDPGDEITEGRTRTARLVERSSIAQRRDGLIARPVEKQHRRIDIGPVGERRSLEPRGIERFLVAEQDDQQRSPG